MKREVVAKDPNLYLVQLTSLRGVACMVVLIGHVIQVINYHYKPAGVVLDTLREVIMGSCNAEGAVLVFFVLSGCVLSLSLKRLLIFDLRSILSFYVKRIFRLYPLLWLSIGLAAVSVMIVRDLAGTGIFSRWLTCNLLSSLSSWHSLLSLTGFYTRYNGPMWSLRVELIYSALFPAIYFVVARVRYRKWIVAVLVIIALMPIPVHFGAPFGLSFAVGAMIPMLPFSRSRFQPILAIIALIVLLFDRLVLAGSNPPERVFDIIETAAAFIIVRDIYASGRNYRLLTSRPAVLLGELSFSIYLLHLPAFLIIFVIIQQYIGTPLILNDPGMSQICLSAITAAVVIFISLFSYNIVELPMHNIGRRIGRLIDNRIANEAGKQPEMAAVGEAGTVSVAS